MKGVTVTYHGSSFDGTLDIPGSKSISNRLLIIKAQEQSPVRFAGLSEADDTVRLRQLLKMIKTCKHSGIPMVVNTGHAGTAMRFLTAFLAQYPGKWLLTGSERMQQRPIGELVTILRQMGAGIEYTKNEGTPPLLITGKRLKGGDFTMNASVSSQFVTALMLIAPRLQKGLTLHFSEQPVSFSYIQMTARLMEKTGANIEVRPEQITVAPSKYKLKQIPVEPDWSSAAFWYELVALAGNIKITIPGLTIESIQGDRALSEVYTHLGVVTEENEQGITISKKGKIKRRLDYDFNNCPDIVPAVMATCSALGVEAVFRGIEHLRFKESDRIEKMQQELGKTGTKIVKEGDSYILIPGKKQEKPLLFETHNDHRLAMSLAPLAVLYEKVTIKDPDVVVKSYPGYWKELEKTGFTIKEI